MLEVTTKTRLSNEVSWLGEAVIEKLMNLEICERIVKIDSLFCSDTETQES